MSNLRALEGPRHLGFTTLNACGMVRKMNGRYYFIIPGADHLIAAPLPNGLFSIEAGILHYDAQVEENLPQQMNPKEKKKLKKNMHCLNWSRNHFMTSPPIRTCTRSKEALRT
jgi:hypothetical protein